MDATHKLDRSIGIKVCTAFGDDGLVHFLQPRKGKHLRCLAKQTLRVVVKETQVVVKEHPGNNGCRDVGGLVPSAKEESSEGKHHLMAKLIRETKPLENLPKENTKQIKLRTIIWVFTIK